VIGRGVEQAPGFVGGPDALLSVGELGRVDRFGDVPAQDLLLDSPVERFVDDVVEDPLCSGP
jgi:hypothetical protein